jgi:hypothetical protein
MADDEHISYPPETRLHQDIGFQGYAPEVAEIHQPKKAAGQGADAGREEAQPCVVTGARQSGTCHQRRQALAVRERRLAQQASGVHRPVHGSGHGIAQLESQLPQARSATIGDYAISYEVYYSQ